SDSRLQEQLSKIGSAEICTIDSYCIGLLRKNFQLTSLPIGFSMITQEEFDPILNRIVPRVIEEMFGCDPTFPLLASSLCKAKDEGFLADELVEIAKEANGKAGRADLFFNAQAALEEAAAGEFFESKLGKLFAHAAASAARGELRKLEDLRSRIPLCDFGIHEEVAGEYAEFFENISGADADGKKYADIRELAYRFREVKLDSSGTRKPERKIATAVINDAKQAAKDIRDGFFPYDSETLSRLLKESAEINRCLGETMRRIFDLYSEEKHREGVADFSEVLREVGRLLRGEDGAPSRIALAERQRFDYVFVDEYQDTNGDQDELFRLISRDDNLFIVGDVKQSIYRFREADPEVFARYRAEFPEYRDGLAAGNPASVFMSDNYRCSRNIIRFTNLVCGFLFKDASRARLVGEGVKYLPKDDLVAHSDEDLPPVRLVSLYGKDCGGTTREAAFIVKEILKKKESLTDPETGTVKWGRIAVLCRKTGAQLDSIVSALSEAGIPVTASEKTQPFEKPEVSLFCSILASVDNPLRDVYLAGALRSPVFGFSLSDLAVVSIKVPGACLWESVCGYPELPGADPVLSDKCRSAEERFRNYRNTAKSMPVDRFVRFLWKDTLAGAYAGICDRVSQSSPRDRKSSLRKLYEYARRSGRSGFGTLHGFVSDMLWKIEKGKTFSTGSALSEDAVSVMTIHASKGLEFDTVFLTGCDKSVNADNKKKRYRFTADTGLVAKLTDKTGFASSEHPLKHFVSVIRDQSESDENISLLYVAMTRAKKELIVTASSKSERERKLFNTSVEPAASNDGRSFGHVAYTFNSFQKQITAALCRIPEGGCFRIEEYDRTNLPIKGEEDGDSNEDHAVTPGTGGEDARAASSFDEDEIAKLTAELRRRIGYEYPYSRSTTVPMKLSVSKLYPDILSEDAPETEPPAERDVLPRFLGADADPAAKGTATHLFLQFCDMGKDYPDAEAVKEEIERLTRDGFISPGDAGVIRVYELVRFFASGFYKTVRNAREIMREKRFTRLISASELVTSPEEKAKLNEDSVLVQGVIDVIVITDNGDVLLCDYKTDRIPADIMRDRASVASFMSERHGSQLSYYRDAVKDLTGRFPSKSLVFPLAYGEAVEIITS
ncbi:MAG: UvrD-helicase domain-containing protein, partial [Clostridia bacterium]|nr:UvrD-helicase domain-containing protein [Clostridia bacterium]